MADRKFTPNAAAQRESLEHLREIIKPGDTVYVVTMGVSPSGMYRRLKVLIAIPHSGRRDPVLDPEGSRPAIRDITWDVGRALRWQLIDSHTWELGVSGAGMDMHFHTVYSLSRALFHDQANLGDTTVDPGYLLTKESL